MPTQIVMNFSGDSRYQFSSDDARAVAKAERRFNELVGAGFLVAERTPTGEARLTKSFDPKSNETLFFPRLVGG